VLDVDALLMKGNQQRANVSEGQRRRAVDADIDVLCLSQVKERRVIGMFVSQVRAFHQPDQYI
jgi:hypothetical protein